MTGQATKPLSPLARLPFYYGWVVVVVAFLTIGVGVSVRTSFSLLFPPILQDFEWDRGTTSAIFSVGFATSTLITPFLGVAIERFGPGLMMAAGSVLVSTGLILSTCSDNQILLYLSLGSAVVGGAIILAYTSHAYLIPFWFVRLRGFATGLAFSGAGIGAIILFPWLQSIIEADGWRRACWAMAIILLVIVLPMNLLFQRRRPEDMGLKPDGDGLKSTPTREAAVDTVVDKAWAATEWTLESAVRTARFWWLALGLFFGMYIWYAIQVHQTQYLSEVGYTPMAAGFALGLVGLFGVVGQIGIGSLSDRIGREWAWTVSISGFVACYILLILMRHSQNELLLWGMVIFQGGLGYGLSSIFGSVIAELFHGRGFGRIFGACGVIISVGAAFGPWISGVMYDRSGNYDSAWVAALGACGLSILGMWLAAPRKVRLTSYVAMRRAT